MKSSCLKLSAFIALLALGGCAVGGGDVVNNADGDPNKKITQMLPKVEKYIATALRESPESFDEPSLNLLKRIAKAMPQERANPKLIGSITNGVDESYQTEARVGATLYFNSIQLDAAGQLSSSRAMTLLIAALGMHHGETDRDFLEKMGAEVVRIYYKYSEV